MSCRFIGGAEVFPFPPKLNKTMEDEAHILCEKKGKGDDSISYNL